MGSGVGACKIEPSSHHEFGRPHWPLTLKVRFVHHHENLILQVNGKRVSIKELWKFFATCPGGAIDVEARGTSGRLGGIVTPSKSRFAATWKRLAIVWGVLGTLGGILGAAGTVLGCLGAS